MDRSFNHDKNYDDIKSLIGKIRSVTLNEEEEIVKTTPEEVGDKSGEKIKFDSINTIGYLSKSDDVNLDMNALEESVGEFIKSSGLLLSYVNIRVEMGRIILTSDVIKNPSLEMVKEIIIDTNEEDVTIELISGPLTLSGDLLNLLKLVTRTYDDPQIGRSNLIKVSQSID